jgi:DNA polymerase III delta prime subunit
MPAAVAPAPAITPAPVAANTNSRLAKVVKGRMKMPLRCLFYGTEGVGKSTLAAHAPDPIWLDIDDGTSLLDIARYPFRDEPGGHVPLTYAEIIAATDDLLRNDHAYQSVIIDTADRLEALLHRFICQRDSKPNKEIKNLENYGYGKGPDIALDEWRALCARLDRLRMHRRMNIIILGHAQIRNFKNPEGDDYDRYLPRIDLKAGGFLKEWCDVTGFCTFEEGGAKLKDTDRAKGFSTGRRIVKLARTAAFDAKSRYAVPAEVVLEEANPWAPFAKAIEDAVSLDLPALAKSIATEVERIGDAELATKVQEHTDKAVKAGDSDALHRFLIDLKRRPAKQTA